MFLYISTRYVSTVYPKKYAHGFCFAVLCCGYTLTDFPISTRLTSLALWQSNDCLNASKATLMNMDKYFMWIHYERLHNHNKAKHNKTVCIFLGIYCNTVVGWPLIPHSLLSVPEAINWHTSQCADICSRLQRRVAQCCLYWCATIGNSSWLDLRSSRGYKNWSEWTQGVFLVT